MVPLQMELGGKDACIVLEDADLDLVAGNIVKGGFSYRLIILILPSNSRYKTKLVFCTDK
jgi:Aldehyde dehydrogenase family